MRKMLVSGDSWTSCWPLEQKLGHRNLGWPSLVAKHFNFELLDKSRAGSSNYRIYRKAVNGIVSNVDLVLVFLTSWIRFETGTTFSPKPGGIYQHLPTRLASAEAFRLFFNGYKNYIDMLMQILSLQALSVVHNVPCFFLDTFHNNLYRDISLEQFKDVLKSNIEVFDNNDDQRILDKLHVVKNLEAKIDWSKFIAKNSYQHIILGCKLVDDHPVEDGHLKIAEVVVNFLESLNYAKTI